MTAILDRPVATVAHCPHGVRWCIANHGANPTGGPVFHDGPMVDLPMSGDDSRGHNRFTLTLERRDGDTIRTRMYLGTAGADPEPGGYASLEEADRIAREILQQVTTARGAKRAADLRIGDRVVIDRTAQTVLALLADGACGTVAVYTDARGVDGDRPAIRPALGEMVPIAGIRLGNTTRLGAAAVAALGRLSRRQRQAMSLRYVDGLPLSEAARLMGVAPEKVKIYVTRAKTTLRTWGVLSDPLAIREVS